MTTTQAIIAAFMERSGLSQRGLALELGVSQPTISRWARGEVEAATPRILALALEALARTDS